MQSFVRTVTKENYESFVEENPEKNKILLFTDRKSTAPLFKSLSKDYKDKLVFGEVKKSETDIYEKYGITETPALLAITDPYTYTSEKYDTLGEMKIDQIKKFLSNIAYRTIKKEKVQELHHLTYKKAKSATTGVCGRKTSNICFIIFTNSGIIDQYKPLLETFISDPVTITYVLTKEEPYMAEQFGIVGEGVVAYKPKRAKYVKAQTDDVKKFIESVLSGGGETWNKVSNENDDGLMFKEIKNKDEL